MERNLPRRQNRSCDSCRQTKRRCVISTQSSNSSTKEVCNNCSSFGRDCTFGFANAQRAAASRKMGSGRNRLSAALEYKDTTSPTSSSVASEKHFNTGDGFSTDNKTLPPEGGSLSNETLDPDIITNEHPCGEARILSDLDDSFEEMSYINPEIFLPENHHSNSPFDFERPLSSPTSLDIDGHVASISPTSPINLLNTSVEAKEIQLELGRIYETVMGTATSSFLSHGSNPFATKWIYHFEGTAHPRNSGATNTVADTCGRKNGTDSWSSMESYVKSLSAPEGIMCSGRRRSNDGFAEERSQRMTMLGIATFLDNFADLYGNILDPHSVRESDMVLRDVIRAFSLQWVSITKSTPSHRDKETSASSLDSSLSYGSHQPQSKPNIESSVFIDSWFKARNRLSSLQSFPSFKVTYALLLFDMIALPVQANNACFEDLEPQRFIRIGLDHLSSLSSLVKSYCDNLGKTSLYSQLLQASLKIFHWFSYVRDTTLAIMRDTPCLLPDALPENRGVIHLNSRLRSKEMELSALSSSSLDLCVQKWCAATTTDLMILWRQAIKFRAHVRGFRDSSSAKSQLDLGHIYSLFRLIDRTEGVLRPFIRECLRIQNFDRLLPSSRLFFSLIVCYWNHGILIFTESVRHVLESLEPLCALGLSAKAMDYNWSSCQSIAVIAQTVLSIPYEDVFSDLSGLAANAPIISFHATPHLIAQVFAQAIETLAIIYHSDGFPNSCGWQHNIETDLAEEWTRCVRPLLKCLSALETTTWGSYTAHSAMKSLMQQFGDTLSECWLPAATKPPLISRNKADACFSESEPPGWDLETYPFFGLGDKDSFVIDDIWLAT